MQQTKHWSTLADREETMDQTTTVSRSITFFFWESDLLEKGENCSQITTNF
jgi:hypothetical protein